MINSCRAQPPMSIALAGVGPSGESALQRLRAQQQPNVHFLHNDGSLAPDLLHKFGLLILVAELESVEDCNAVQALAQQVQSSGFGTNTLYVVMNPAATVGERQKVLAHYSLQMLEMHADATVVVPGDSGEDLGIWLTDRVASLAQAVANDAFVGIDVDDLTGLLRNAGSTVWASAQSEGVDRVDAAVKAICKQHAQHVSVEPVYQQAMIWVQGARESLKLSEMRSLMKSLGQQILKDTPRLVFCVAYDESLGTRMRVSALLCRPQMRSS